AVSTDGIHYGPDFQEVPFGAGGVEAYNKATNRDRALLRGPLSGPATAAKARKLYATFVDPANPDQYRWTWCGRFAVPTGLLLLDHLARDLSLAAPIGHPVAYSTSVGAPELPLREAGVGATAPTSLYHFVGYPAVALTVPEADHR